MEELLKRLGINYENNIFDVKEDLEQKQLDTLAKLDVIQSKAEKSYRDKELEKQLQNQLDDIEEALKIIQWTMKRISTGLSAYKKDTTLNNENKNSFDENKSNNVAGKETAESERNDTSYLLNKALTCLEYLKNDYGRRKASELMKKISRFENNTGKAGLALMYLEGLGIEKEPDKAFLLAKEAAEDGNPYGQYIMGIMYENGHVIDKDDFHAAEYYWKAAMQGFALAQCKLGNLYYNGTGVIKDIDEAKKWYEMAAAQKNAEAEYHLACLYEMEKNENENVEKGVSGNNNISKDNEKAAEYYRRSAEHGYAPAQVIIGKRYLTANSSKDIEEAKKWILKAAEQEYVEAEYLLAKMYEEGTVFEKNDKKAADYYRLSAEHGNVDAQYWLAQAFYDGKGGIDKNLEEAAKWFKKAAEQDNTSAQRMLGIMYSTGEGVEKDYRESFKWTELAAEKGDYYAQYNLGLMYYYGKAGWIDYYAALRWLWSSAKKGFAKAQYMFGVALYEHDFTELDKYYKDVEEFLSKAGEQGIKDAYAILYKLYIKYRYKKFFKNPIELYQCINKAGDSYENEKRQFINGLAKGGSLENLVWLKRIADEENDLYACLCLGDMYFNGKGTAKNYQEAYRYYKRAAQGGIKGYNLNLRLEKINEEITRQLTYKEALKLLETSSFGKGIETLKELAEKNYADAQFMLGKLYLDGYRMPKDYKAAYDMFNKARENGHPDADSFIKSNKYLLRYEHY